MQHATQRLLHTPPLYTYLLFSFLNVRACVSGGTALERVVNT